MRDRVLYRIITGRLQFSRGDLFLYINDPNADLINRSYEVYDSVYEEAIAAGNYVESESFEILAKNRLWTPHDDKQIEEMREQIKNLKVYAYENYYKGKELINTKRHIRKLEKDVTRIESKKNQLYRQTCEGLAEEERRVWLIYNSVFDKEGRQYKFGQDLSEEDIINYYLSNGLNQSQIRDISKNDPWRTMWMISTKTGDLFDRPSTDLTEYQLSLCQYSVMYDNVYQAMESPPEEVVMDDDCLDGWFIVQRKKQDQDRLEKSKKTLFSNPKIANSQEVILMAKDPEDAKRIFDMNDARAKQAIRDRGQVINDKGRAKQGHFEDVKQDQAMKANKGFVEQIRKGK
jgi:hypothetical protein